MRLDRFTFGNAKQPGLAGVRIEDGECRRDAFPAARAERRAHEGAGVQSYGAGVNGEAEPVIVAEAHQVIHA
jgi:hypothetical protein